jgi:DNA-binding transcriptional ArsR family regulator
VSVFAALGDETRLSLVATLSVRKPRSVSQLARDFKLTPHAITRHLRVLEDAEIVRRVRAGRDALVVFDPRPIEGTKTYLDLVSAQWYDALPKLRKFVED